MRTAILLLALVCPAVISAQALQFNQLPGGSGSKPAPRFDGPIAYDPQTQQVYMFGGQDTTTENDLWAYSMGSQSWTSVATSGAKPPARFGHTLLLDPVRRRLIVFGGQAGNFFSDTWAFDLSAKSWQQLSPDEAGPKRRYGHSAIYDASRDRIVISHGFTESGRFDDTWAFNLTTNTWQDISPASGRPLRRCLHHGAYDPKRDQMYLYAGCSSGFGPCPQEDFWTFDLQNNRWTERASSPRPPARERYGMVFDTRRDRLIVFGGEGASALLNDTWEYDPQAQTWTPANIAGASPANRNRLESVFAPDSGAMIFFGGVTDSGLSNEIWTLGPAAAAPAAAPSFSAASMANAFSGAGGTFAPGEIVSIFGSALGPMAGKATVLDPQTGRLPTQAGGVAVDFGGFSAPLYFVRADQLNVQVPYQLSGATGANVTVTYQGTASSPVRASLGATHPGLYPRAFNQDGAVNSATNPARAGSVVVLFATGQGVTDPASESGALAGNTYPVPVAATSATIGGAAAELLFRGQAPGTAGVIQLNVKIPDGLASGTALPMVLTIGSARSQDGVGVWVQ